MEDRPLEIGDGAIGFDPQRLDQRRSQASVHRERVGLPRAAVQREHELSVEALVEREFGDQRFEVGDDRGVLAEIETRVDECFDGAEPELLESGRFGHCELGVAKLSKGLAAP